MKEDRKFLYTLQHPTCSVDKFTQSPQVAEAHSRIGWIVHGRSFCCDGNIFKYTNDKLM